MNTSFHSQMNKNDTASVNNRYDKPKYQTTEYRNEDKMIKSIERYTKQMNHYSWNMNNSFQIGNKNQDNHQNNKVQHNVVQNIKTGFERSDPKIIKNNIYKFTANKNKYRKTKDKYYHNTQKSYDAFAVFKKLDFNDNEKNTKQNLIQINKGR